jgi:hypothetical protein
MNTPSHAILNLAILGRKAHPEWNLAIVLGGILPDAMMFVFYGWTRFLQNQPESRIWGELYYEPLWQDLFDIWNAIPLISLVLLMALGLKRQGVKPVLNSQVAIGCVSMILHCVQDLFTHRDDAHRHFWPLSNFRFESPVSYWDPNHYGAIFAPIELGLVLLASFYGFRLIRSRWGKGCLIATDTMMVLAFWVMYL